MGKKYEVGTNHEAAYVHELRERAERLRRSQPATDVPELDGEEAARLIHDLETHQIELQLQNEELRRAQQELAEAHDRYADLYDLAPVGYATLDEQGVITEANVTVAEMLGEARARLAGRKLSDYVASDHQSPYFIDLRALLAQGGRRQSELRLRRSDGSLLWVSVEWLHVADRSRGAAQVRVALSDRSEYKALQTQLAQADRLSSLGLLSAGVAHEINNPLTFVLCNLETLAESLPSSSRQLAALHQHLDSSARPQAAGVEQELAELTELAGSAAEGARRIREIAQRLRVFSGLDREPTTALKIATVLDAAVPMVRHELEFRARLVTRYDDLPEIVANPGELCQVFLNLLVNAVHAIPEGDVERNAVRVTAEQEGEQVVVAVRDTGCGIAPEHLDQIFDPFFTTKGVGAGSGLGLSICQKIVTSYGGRIDVSSAPGRGSVFEVRLPVAARERRKPERHASTTPETTEPPVLGRVLVVDDEPGVAYALARMLGAHDVQVVHSGLDARDLIARGEPFDVILCDLMMPGFSGMDLHGWLLEERPALVDRVVFMTGAAFTPQAQQLLQEVANPRIDKPFSRRQIEAAVRQVMMRAR